MARYFWVKFFYFSIRLRKAFNVAKNPELAYWRDIALAEIMRHADPRALKNTAPEQMRVREHPFVIPAASQDRWLPAPKAAISVLLGTYNRLDALKLAIESIRNNGFTEPYEIIVVDGGSTDGSIKWLSEQTDILLVLQHNRDPEKNNARRRSWGYFMNLGFKIAESPWVLMISDDCLLLPGAMANSLAQVRKLESAGKDIGGVAYYFRNWPMDARYFVQHTIGGMLMVNHGLFSKRALLDVGNVNEEDFSFYKADSDLSLKLWHQGYEIVDCPEAFVEHLVLPSEELRSGNTQSMHNDRVALFEKWRSIYAHSNIPELFESQERQYLDYRDTGMIAERFRPLLEQESAPESRRY